MTKEVLADISLGRERGRNGKETKVKIVTLDWRTIGDFSAVGQLTEKIFSNGYGITVYPLQCSTTGASCKVFTRHADGRLEDIFGRKVVHDAVLEYLKTLEPDVFYVRLSHKKGVLEMASKLAVVLPHVPLIVHYMDKPNFKGMASARKDYIAALYRFLIQRADGVYTIHKSSLPWLRAEFGREARVLANFISTVPEPKHDLHALQDRPINIYYFGSVLENMNARAIARICRAVSNLSWVRLCIWTNSDLGAEVRQVCESSYNIEVSGSNLGNTAFKAKLAEADLLLLAYNADAESKSFLEHSFSNKFVDYLEAGGIILCVGPPTIPTVQACRESGLALVLEGEAELVRVFEEKECLLNRLAGLDLDQYAVKVRLMKADQAQLLEAFFEDIKRRAMAGKWGVLSGQGKAAQRGVGEGPNQLQCAFLSRRQIYDQENGSQQSLSSTLMAQIINMRIGRAQGIS